MSALNIREIDAEMKLQKVRIPASELLRSQVRRKSDATRE